MLTKKLLLFLNFQSSAIAGLFSAAIICRLNADIFFALIIGTLSFLLCAFAFVSNDILDFKKDSTGGRFDKLLVSGEIAYRDAVIITLSILLLIFVISIIISPRLFLGMFVLSIFSFLYSFFAQKFPLGKGLYTALLSLSPVFIPYLVLGGYPSITILCIVFVYILGREIILDINDFVADGLFDLKTIPHLLGKNISYFIGVFFMIAPIIGCVYIYNSVYLKTSFLIMLFIHSLIFLIYKNNINFIVNVTRFLMLIMIILLFILS